VRAKMFVDGRLNPDMVGQSAYGLGKLFGVNVPQRYKVGLPVWGQEGLDVGPSRQRRGAPRGRGNKAAACHSPPAPPRPRRRASPLHHLSPRASPAARRPPPQVLIGEVEKIGDDEPLSHVRPLGWGGDGGCRRIGALTAVSGQWGGVGLAWRREGSHCRGLLAWYRKRGCGRRGLVLSGA
jgi:hypothetical protein